MLISGKEFKIGADPELFLKKGDGFISAYNMIPGDKYMPHKVENGAVQVDGMALEFNIDPATHLNQWEENITSVMRTLRNMIPDDYEMVVKPVATFGEDYIKSQPEDARMLGCSPDFNAYTGMINPRPKGDCVDFRTAAGHIHIGWTENQNPFGDEHFSNCMKLVRWMDITLGLPSVFLDRDAKRRELYGKAGAFRPKPYGVEYRVLSNFWLKSKRLRKFAFDGTVEAIKRSVLGGMLDLEQDEIIKTLNTNSVLEAKKFYKQSYQAMYGG